MCLHLCVVPLVTCPGFWIGDIIGTCTMVSVPPLCSQAFFFNMVRLCGWIPQWRFFGHDRSNGFASSSFPRSTQASMMSVC